MKPNVTCQLKTIKSPENSYMREWTYKHMSNYTLVSFFYLFAPQYKLQTAVAGPKILQVPPTLIPSCSLWVIKAYFWKVCPCKRTAVPILDDFDDNGALKRLAIAVKSKRKWQSRRRFFWLAKWNIQCQ